MTRALLLFAALSASSLALFGQRAGGGARAGGVGVGAPVGRPGIGMGASMRPGGMAGRPGGMAGRPGGMAGRPGIIGGGPRIVGAGPFASPWAVFGAVAPVWASGFDNYYGSMFTQAQQEQQQQAQSEKPILVSSPLYDPQKPQPAFREGPSVQVEAPAPVLKPAGVLLVATKRGSLYAAKSWWKENGMLAFVTEGDRIVRLPMDRLNTERMAELNQRLGTSLEP
jgi:hypothetical protein